VSEQRPIWTVSQRNMAIGRSKQPLYDASADRHRVRRGRAATAGRAFSTCARAQLAAAEAAQGSQLALFATLHDDRRLPAARTAAGRYLEPGLFEN
jgi:hypothetical protein